MNNFKCVVHCFGFFLNNSLNFVLTNAQAQVAYFPVRREGISINAKGYLGFFSHIAPCVQTPVLFLGK